MFFVRYFQNSFVETFLCARVSYHVSHGLRALKFVALCCFPFGTSFRLIGAFYCMKTNNLTGKVCCHRGTGSKTVSTEIVPSKDVWAAGRISTACRPSHIV